MIPTSNTAAWLAFSGVIIVAVLAAVTAQLRLNRQLKHERELKDLEELRALLDECAQMAGETSQLGLALFTRLVGAEKLPKEPPVEHPAPLLRKLGVDVVQKPTDYLSEDATIRALEDAFYAAAKPVFGFYQRLILRLGEEHEVSANYLTLQMSWVAMGLSWTMANTEPKSKDRSDQIAFVSNEMNAAHFGFLRAAQRLVESRLPSP